MGIKSEIKDEINRTVARQELDLGKTTTTVLDAVNQQVVFVIEEKSVAGGKTLTKAFDSKGNVGGEWVE